MPPPCHSTEPSSCIDIVYANGAKIAKANPLDAPLHISGDDCYSCGGTASYVNLSSGAGYVIQTGDALNLTQYNAGDSVGGLILRFADGSQTSGLVAQDQNGQQINCDAVANQLHNRHIDLSAYAGETLASTLVIDDVCSPGGHFDLYLNDIAIVGGSGQVTTIYSPQLGATYAMVDATAAWPGPVANMRAVSEPNTYVPAGATHYYIGDHLGTTQMEFAGGGWPLWQGSFAPFGQEVLPGVAMDFVGPLPADGTAMHYKFTGKERDTESGLDYFGARYYASNMGRFMSPDWTAEADPVPYAELDNPQTLNLYSYVQNNPLNRTDPFGHASDPCNGNPNCVTVTADGPAMIPLLEAGGHHFVDQSLIRAKDAWSSLSGQFFRRWSTGKLPNPGLHKGFSTPHRLNSAQIRNIIDKVEKEVGKPMSKWDASDIEKAVEEVKSADGDTGAFLSHIAENNSAARTVTADIQDVMSAAKGAMNSIKANAGAIEEDVKDAVAACEEGGCPPP